MLSGAAAVLFFKKLFKIVSVGGAAALFRRCCMNVLTGAPVWLRLIARLPLLLSSAALRSLLGPHIPDIPAAATAV